MLVTMSYLCLYLVCKEGIILKREIIDISYVCLKLLVLQKSNSLEKSFSKFIF